MPITLVDLKRNRRKLDLEFDGEAFYVIYKPNEITPEKREQMLMREDGNDDYGLCKLLADIIVEWDILPEKDAEPFEINADIIFSFPDSLLGCIFDEIIEDQNERSALKNLGDGSSLTDGRARRRRGIR